MAEIATLIETYSKKNINKLKIELKNDKNSMEIEVDKTWLVDIIGSLLNSFGITEFEEAFNFCKSEIGEN